MMNWKNLVFGTDTRVPVIDGTVREYVNLDNAASTPPLKEVMDVLNEFAPWYSSVHRGTGYKSLISTHAYEQAREIIADFVGADTEEDVVVFCKNTTEALNILANLVSTRMDGIVLTSEMEHHSNLLTWRKYHQVEFIHIDEQGRLDEEDLDAKLQQYSGRIAAVAVSGGSNVSGYIPDIHRIAKKAHQAGALFVCDAAQLAPHRAIDMGKHGEDGHIDFVALSAHKMYAPFGGGALIGPRSFFNSAEPLLVGGGVVDIVTLDETYWNLAPDRNEAGSPNILGALAMAVACRTMKNIGFDKIADHERQLTSYALQRLSEIPGMKILGSADASLPQDRLGVIAFNLEQQRHSLVSAVMGYEHAIGVRSGCFCAHPYLLKLMHVDEQQAQDYQLEVRQGNKTHLPGAVRISFGLYNEQPDIDAAVDALHSIARGEIKGKYIQETASGDHLPEVSPFPLDDHMPAIFRSA